MIRFLFQKMRKNKWLILCLLSGNILLVAISAATPMYQAASMTRMIHQAMRLHQTSEGEYPAVSRLGFIFNEAPAAYRMQTYEYARDALLPWALNMLNIPVHETVRAYSTAGWRMVPDVRRDTPGVRTRTLNLWAMEYFYENISIMYGRMPSDGFVPEFHEYSGEIINVIEVLAANVVMFRQDLLYGELLRVIDVYNQEEGEPYLYVRVVGIFEIPIESAPYWSMFDMHVYTALHVADGFIQNHIIPYYHRDYRLTARWINVHDFEAMTGRLANSYVDGIDRVTDFLRERHWQFSVNYNQLLLDHIDQIAGFSITLLVLQMPLYFLLAFYIYVVSRKVLQLEQNDITVLKSRGAGRGQIFVIYLTQGLLIGLAAFPLGMLLGVAMCHLFGASNGFLELVQRAPLVVELSAQAFLFGGVAAVFSFFTMIIPVVSFSRTGIVEYKRSKTGVAKKSLWQRYFLDVLCLLVSGLGIYNFNIQQDLLGMQGRQWIDPTLFIASTLFMVGLGLFMLRLFPYIVKLIFIITRRFLPLAMYASFIKVTRSNREEQFIMIFLVFTMAVGIFSAQAARTINLNAEHEILYLYGADIVFQEVWNSNILQVRAGATDSLVFSEPSFERFTGIDEVDSVTRVMRENLAYVDGSVRGRRMTALSVPLLAIEPRSFGETIWFRDDLLQIHVNHYLNILAQVPSGVLVSSSFRDMGFEIGNQIQLTHTRRIMRELDVLTITHRTNAVIVGFIERWPTFVPMERMTGAGDHVTYVDRHMIVGNLGYFQHQWGIWPYQVWMRTNTDSSMFFYDFRLENDLWLTQFNDASASAIENRSEPLLQGTNGVLTMNFIVTLLVCFTGFLMYWILSIKERVLQFGVFRALGVSMRSIAGLLINEQFLITLTALLMGAVVGEASARLFIPLIQLAYTNQIIPLLVVIEARDYANMFYVMGTMIVLCLLVLLVFISKIRIDQALKLGED